MVLELEEQETPAKERAMGKKAKTTTEKKRDVQEQEVKKDLAKTYNQYKEFEGKRYTGAKVGRGHKWNYDAGEWREKKMTPDKWEFTYAVTKRGAGRAPEGSGVPVGTEYDWYILAHQHVRKLNANDYTTAMSGVKFKLAHKRADKEKWSASDAAQRKRLIKLLRETIEELERGPEEAAQEEMKVASKKSAGKPAKAAVRKKPEKVPEKAAAGEGKDKSRKAKGKPAKAAALKGK